MRYSGLRYSIAGCVLLCATSAQAVTYKIETTDDVAVSAARVGSGENTRWQVSVAEQDGICSLREALYAINYRQPVDGCEAGSGSNDVIRLQPGASYVLEHGDLPVGGGNSIRFQEDEEGQTVAVDLPLASNVRIELQLEPFVRPGNVDPAELTSNDQSRLFAIQNNGSLNLSYLVLRDGQAIAGNGGLIHSSGNLQLGEGMQLQAGTADNGGAVYLQEQAFLSFPAGVRFENNTVAGKGSVIATAADFRGAIQGSRFFMAGNQAGIDGGTIYLGGDEEQQVAMVLSDGTFTGNQGGVLRVESPYRVTDLANLTIAFNDGIGLYLEESAFPPEEPVEEEGGDPEVVEEEPAEEEVPVEDEPPAPLSTDNILHTVIVGNDQGCLIAGDPTVAAEVSAFLFTATDDSGCPEPEPANTLNLFPNEASGAVLLGLNEETGKRVPCPVDARGANSCLPLLATTLDSPFPGFLPNPEIGEGQVEVTALLDRAAPETEVTNQCTSTDMRGKPRGGVAARCDIGAVEFIPAQSRPIEIKLISGQSVLADVLEGGLNDALIDCRRLAEGEECMRVVIEPGRGVASVEIDSSGYPRLRYTPSTAFHGVDSLRYVANRDAFIGGTDRGVDLSDRVNFVAEPASGLTKSESAGAGGAFFIAAMLVLGGLRRCPPRWRLALLLVLAGPAWAAEIEVTTLDDQVIVDGQCSLREALQNAAGGDPSPDCAFGDKTGSDTIILPAGTIKLNSTLQILGGNVVLQGQGARQDGETHTTIQGDGSFRLFEVLQQGVGNGYVAVTFRQLRLQGGAARGTDGNGEGAVLSTGGSVTLDRVVVTDNHADRAGGVVMLRTNAGSNKNLIINRSYFHNNSAALRGGVIASNPLPGEGLTVRVADSTFADNRTEGQGGVFSLAADTGSVMAISNSLFFNNQADTASVMDLSNFIPKSSLMNLTLVSDDPAVEGVAVSENSGEITLGNSIYLGFADIDDEGGCLLDGQLKTSAFNLFDCDPTLLEADSRGNRFDGERADLQAALEADSGNGADYIPPFLPATDPSEPNRVVNQGNDEELASGTSSPERCRSVDMRGISRTSGERCDRGAVEFQEITAGDDEGNNRSMPDRRVIADILGNDIPSDGASLELVNANGEFLPERLQFVGFTPAGKGYEDASGNRIDMVWEFFSASREDFDVFCGEPLPQLYIDNVDDAQAGDIARDCVLLYTPVDQGQDLDVCRPPGDSRDAYQKELQYRFSDDAGEQSELATVTLTIFNKAPIITGQTRVNKAGESLVFDVEVESPDGSGILWDTLRVKDKPRFASKDQLGEVEGVGILLNTPSQGQVTYIPESNFNTFRDSFTLQISDDCGTASAATPFRVRYPDSSASGTGVTGGVFHPGYVALALLLLLGRRRRPAGGRR